MLAHIIQATEKALDGCIIINKPKQNKNAEKNARQMEMFDIETNNA